MKEKILISLTALIILSFAYAFRQPPAVYAKHDWLQLNDPSAIERIKISPLDGSYRSVNKEFFIKETFLIEQLYVEMRGQKRFHQFPQSAFHKWNPENSCKVTYYLKNTSERIAFQLDFSTELSLVVYSQMEDPYSLDPYQKGTHGSNLEASHKVFVLLKEKMKELGVEWEVRQ